MKNNVLLINPAVNPASQNRIINESITKVIPTSLGYLAGYLEKIGTKGVSIIDEQIRYMTDLELEATVRALSAPKIVGISVLTITCKRAHEIATKVKRCDRGATVVFGGIHATVLPEEALNNENVDVVVRGEGEETLNELADLMLKGKDFRHIQGISFKRSGSVIHNPDRPLMPDLNRIPLFPYHLFEKDIAEYTSFNLVFTSRGCPYNCKFCSSRNVAGKRYRYFEVERIIAEIRLLIDKYAQRMIWLVDDNPAAHRARFSELLDRIISGGLNKKAEFLCSMRGDNLDDGLLDKLKEANFRLVGFGLETGSEELMKIIDKGETVIEVADSIRKTSAKGIETAATLIFGLPTETRKDRRDTMKLVGSLPLSSVRYNILTPYPGTEIFEELYRSGKLLIKEHWENFAVQYMWESDDIPYVPEGNSRYELLFDTMFANLSFYFSFNGLKQMLRSSKAGGNVIDLKDKWYLSFSTVFKLTRIFLYISRRFLVVSVKLIAEKRLSPYLRSRVKEGK
ncbi:MAG: B12-binding domain-containing radical SAM protein [Candidatus Omnitrophica bacterium]|nr:B12-binding domain-containing radical SAM protein [Candidatus Omnitrophota bacterium]